MFESILKAVIVVIITNVAKEIIDKINEA